MKDMKDTRRWGALLVALAVGTTAGGIYGLGSTGPTARTDRTPSQPGGLVAQPSEWVPFSADIRQVGSAGTTAVGRFYRSSDGSTRSETGDSFDALDTVAIKNIKERAFYLHTVDGAWTVQPMDLPPWGWKPMPTRFGNGMTPVPETVEGFSLIRSESGPVVLYRSPELNLFVLITAVPCETGRAVECGISHSNIVLGEQPEEHFQPPAGVRVMRVDKPGGIVRHNSPPGVQ